MNWKEIDDKYPKAGKLSIKWWTKTGASNNDRNLYDFFDEQGVYIKIEPGVTFKTKQSDTPDCRKFLWKIYKDLIIGDIAMEPCKYDTRKEAEEQAFMKAFEILEEQP